MTTQPTRLEVRANMQLTDEQIEAMANACGLYGVRKAVVACVRELLSASKPAAPMGQMQAAEIIKQWIRDHESELNYTEFARIDASLERLMMHLALSASPAAPAQSAEPVAEVQGSDLVLGRESRALRWLKGVDPYSVAPGTKLYAAPQPAQTAQPDRCYAPSCGKWDGNDSCTCQRLGDWKGFHHPLCDQSPATSAVVLDDERAAFEEHFSVPPEQIRAFAVNTYADPYLQRMWLGWQHRARAAFPQPVEQTRALTTPIAIRTDQIAEIAGKYALGNPRLDALRGFVNEVIIVNGAEYAKSE